MLVLTRRVGETIVIDEHTRVTVVAVDGNRIRLGISAPEHVRVDRNEVHQRRMERSQTPSHGAGQTILAKRLRSRQARALVRFGF
jgi:carbon storage regulator